MATSRLQVDPEYIAKADAPGFADAFARIGEYGSMHCDFVINFADHRDQNHTILLTRASCPRANFSRRIISTKSDISPVSLFKEDMTVFVR